MKTKVAIGGASVHFSATQGITNGAGFPKDTVSICNFASPKGQMRKKHKQIVQTSHWILKKTRGGFQVILSFAQKNTSILPSPDCKKTYPFLASQVGQLSLSASPESVNLLMGLPEAVVAMLNLGLQRQTRNDKCLIMTVSIPAITTERMFETRKALSRMGWSRNKLSTYTSTDWPGCTSMNSAKVSLEVGNVQHPFSKYPFQKASPSPFHHIRFPWSWH